MVEPFFFGPRGALAFYHPSAGSVSRSLLIICPPLFDEYQRSYRALADLANACASHPQGPHALRIDYCGTGEAQGLLSEVSIGDWLDDISHAIDEGIALTGADKVILMGVRFGATLAAQCDHSAIVQYLFWDPIDTGREYLGWLEHVNSMLKSKCHTMAKQINRKLENIPYVVFDLTESLRQGFEKLAIESFFEKHHKKVWILTTSKNNIYNGRYPNCEYSGIEYDWPIFHQGNLNPKPVLESIAKRVLKQ